MLFNCDECTGQGGLTLDAMKRHNRRDHKDKKVECEECMNVFKNENCLLAHKKMKHGFEEEDTTVFCIYCPQSKQFGNAEALKKHSKSAHGHSKFICSNYFNWFSIERFKEIHKKDCK